MRQILRRIPLTVLPIFIFLLSFGSPAEAQYFGRNKVHYKEFKFEVLKTDHFDIYFYEEERENAGRESAGWPSAGMRASRTSSSTRCPRGSRW